MFCSRSNSKEGNPARPTRAISMENSQTSILETSADFFSFFFLVHARENERRQMKYVRNDFTFVDCSFSLSLSLFLWQRTNFISSLGDCRFRIKFSRSTGSWDSRINRNDRFCVTDRHVACSSKFSNATNCRSCASGHSQFFLF